MTAHVKRRLTGKQTLLCTRAPHIAALPGEVLDRILSAGTIRELLWYSFSSLHAHKVGASIFHNKAIHATLSIGDSCDDALLHQGSFLCQGLGPQALRATFSIPSAVPISAQLLPLLVGLLPFGDTVNLEVFSVLGLGELSSNVITTLSKWPLQTLGLAQLEEDEVTLLCPLLASASKQLQVLRINNFCRDDPSPRHLAPILASLPASCVELQVHHALPLTHAFAEVPFSVQTLGTVVVMAEVFYHSRVVGMSVSRFVASFPSLPGVQNLQMVLGPGHYEEPTWPSVETFVDGLCKHFPSLSCLQLEVLVESATVPPVSAAAALLKEHGIEVVIGRIRPARGASSLDAFTTAVQAAGVKFKLNPEAARSRDRVSRVLNYT